MSTREVRGVKNVALPSYCCFQEEDDMEQSVGDGEGGAGDAVAIRRARKGIYEAFARGNPKSYHHRDKEDSDEDDDDDFPSSFLNSSYRKSAGKYETSLFQKLDCVMGDLMMSPRKISAWLVAARCLQMRRSFIKGHICNQADVEILLGGKKFGALKCQPSLTFQEPASNLSENDNHITNDFFVFAKHPWTIYSSLVGNLHEIKPSSNAAHNKNRAALVDLERRGEKDKFQEIWAGLYIKALSVVQERCLLVSIAIAHTMLDSPEGRKSYVTSLEELGTMKYEELQGGIVYGFTNR